MLLRGGVWIQSWNIAMCDPLGPYYCSESIDLPLGLRYKKNLDEKFSLSAKLEQFEKKLLKI